MKENKASAINLLKEGVESLFYWCRLDSIEKSIIKEIKNTLGYSLKIDGTELYVYVNEKNMFLDSWVISTQIYDCLEYYDRNNIYNIIKVVYSPNRNEIVQLRDLKYRKRNCELSNEECISLMGIYLSEWQHRDSSLWIQIYAYYIGVFLLILSPVLINGDAFEMYIKHLVCIIELLSIILSTVVTVLSVIYSERMNFAGKAYRNIIRKLPKGYRMQETPRGILCIPAIKLFSVIIMTIQYLMAFVLYFDHL